MICVLTHSPGDGMLETRGARSHGEFKEDTMSRRFRAPTTQWFPLAILATLLTALAGGPAHGLAAPSSAPPRDSALGIAAV